MWGRAPPGALAPTEAVAALQSFHAAGIRRIYFTGGEPFSRADFWSILETARELDIETGVITNGMYLKSPSDVVRLKGLCTHLGISLDGADQATNDSLRGDGVYAHVMNLLRWCKTHQLPTTLYVTITRRNYTQIETLSFLAASQNCQIHFNEVTIDGRALSNEDDLRLTEAQRSALPHLAVGATEQFLGETLGEPDSSCWVRSNALYMSSDGNLYVCSEVSQRHHEVPIGNIRSFSVSEWIANSNETDDTARPQCCYSSEASQYAVLIRNTGNTCAYAPIDDQICSLNKLNQAFDKLYEGMSENCSTCQDPDCMGYTWLLDEEVNTLYEVGVPLVQINNGPTFIHSFPTNEEGAPNLTTRYPTCSQLCDSGRGCTIYENRPFVCHMYPIGLETTTDDKVVWVLHLDCLHVRKMQENGTIRLFEHRARNIIGRISPDLMNEILAAYTAVDEISSFPDGENNYRTLMEV